MTHYVSPIDDTVRSVFAHSIEFKAGEPVLCPPAMHDELVARGILPVGEPEVVAEAVAEEIPTDPVAAPDAPVEEPAA